MKIGVLLAGCGVFDGSEIHEATFALLAIDQLGAEAVCFAPNKDQFHVINHLTGEEVSEKRNVLVESARIARGKVSDIKTISVDDFDALVIPGGFGAAKNLNQWAISGPEGEIDDDVRRIILECVSLSKPIAALCMGPTVVAKALEDSGFHPTLTVGTTELPSPYEIGAISDGMKSIGSEIEFTTIEEVLVDDELRIVSAPCYMMEASIAEIYDNVFAAVEALVEMIDIEDADLD